MVSPRKSRRKSVCFSSTVTERPARASNRASIRPAGPPPTMQQSSVLSDSIANTMPDFVFYCDGCRSIEHRRHCRRIRTGRNHRDFDLSVGIVPVASCVARIERRSDAGNAIDCAYDPDCSQLAEHELPFGIDVRCDMMSDLSGISAKSDIAVERCRAEPDVATLSASLQHFPETNMVAMGSACTDRLFECNVLFPPLVKQIADRRSLIGAAEDDTLGNFNIALDRKRIGPAPPCCRHRANNFIQIANQSDIQRVARHSCRIAREHGRKRQMRLTLVMAPKGRKQQISQGDIGKNRRAEVQQPPCLTRERQGSFLSDDP